MDMGLTISIIVLAALFCLLLFRFRYINAEAYLEKGITAFRQGHFDLAITRYSEAIRLDPNFVKAYCYRSEA